MNHPLRMFVDANSPTITDDELLEFEKVLCHQNLVADMREFLGQFEHHDNHILTKDLAERDEAITSMCCGIEVFDIDLTNGETLYFAFDHGH
jgi:hypothetical protein